MPHGQDHERSSERTQQHTLAAVTGRGTTPDRPAPGPARTALFSGQEMALPI